MKKVLSFIIASLLVLTCTACTTKIPQSESGESNQIETTAESTTAILETSKNEKSINPVTLSNEEFANILAKDSSTSDVVFTVDKYSDDMYFLRCDNENIDAHIGFSSYGKNITFSFTTDGGEDECYYVLLNALSSELFNIPFDDQIDILAHYKVDEINYSGSSVRITETVKDDIRVIGIRMN